MQNEALLQIEWPWIDEMLFFLFLSASDILIWFPYKIVANDFSIVWTRNDQLSIICWWLMRESVAYLHDILISKRNEKEEEKETRRELQ